MLHFVICDDNLNILDKLEKMLENIFTKNNFDAKVSFTSDNSDKILEYIKSNPSDVLLLDINLKSNKTGLELAEEIRKVKKNSYLIFTTGHLEYAMVAYKYKTFDYIAKPITYDRLEDTIIRLFDDINGLLILLNTVGGDVEAGLAIAELIAGMKKPTVSLVIGGGHSIGVPLAVAAKQSFIAPSAAMTIHPVRMSGTIIASPQTYSYFKSIQERITTFVTTHSNISADTFEKLMMATDQMSADVGTVVGGKQAVSYGLIDHVGSLSDALDCLHKMIK